MTQGQNAGTKRVTLVDVAAAAGVDKAIVSRVVNRDPTLLIRPETRVRVEAAITELGYRPNLSARSLRTAKTGILGLVIPDFSNPVYAQIIAGAEAAALSSGHVLVTGSASGAASPAEYLDLLGNGRVDGLLIAGGAPSAQEQRILDGFDIPWLLVNRRDRNSHRYVILDDAKAAGMAVDHLADQGHTEIAHIAGPKAADTAQRRLEGFTAAMAAHGLRAPASRIVMGEYTMDGGAEAAAKLLSARRRPTAIYVANVAAAVGVLHELAGRGLSVPSDVSVVTTHDTDLASHVMPALTTVRMPLRKLGATAVRELLDNPPDAAVEQILSDDFTLVLRDSTAGPSDQAGL